MPTEITTASAFYDWLRSPGAGPSIIYHRGFLAHDIHGDYVTAEGFALMTLANAVWAAALDGQVYLVQRRFNEPGKRSEWEYLAVRPRDGKVPDHSIPGARVIVNHAAYMREYNRTRAQAREA